MRTKTKHISSIDGEELELSIMILLLSVHSLPGTNTLPISFMGVAGTERDGTSVQWGHRLHKN